MKRICIVILSLVWCNYTYANKTNVVIVENDNDKTILDVQVGAIKKELLYNNSYKITLDGATQLLEKGKPDIPKLSYSFTVNNTTTPTIEIYDAQYYEINSIDIASSKGNIVRTINPKSLPYMYDAVYSQDAFFPTQSYTHSNLYTIRNKTGLTYHFYPVQYNPIQKTLRVYTHFKIKVIYNHTSENNIASNTENIEIYESMYKNRFINYTTNTSNKTLYTPITQEGSMLVLCPQEYITTIQPFIEWKERKGIKCYVVNIDTLTGGKTFTNIKNCITTYNNNVHQAYILLIGDQSKLPCYQSGFVIDASDYGYTYYSNDHYPDCAIGRLSCETTDELTMQINKILAYEKTPNIATTWMQTQISIGSNEGGNGDGDDNQADWEHERDIADSNKNQYNYLTNVELYDGSHGGNDAVGNPSVTDLTTAVNTGASLVNYTGHGSTFAINTTNCTTTDIMSMNNNSGKWPFFFIVGCRTGNFTNFTCFAEQLQRNGSLGQETGSIATFSSTIDQYWEPPMQAQDEFNAIMRGARSTNLKTTLGSICVDACASMNDQYNTATFPNDGNDMTDTWIFFGDPSLQIFNKNLGVLNCNHTTKIHTNSTNYSVNCPIDGATVGLYYQGAYLADAKVSGGVATFTFPPIAVMDTMYVTVTKQNYATYYGKVFVDTAAGAGTNNLHTDNTVEIFPNPTKNMISISTSNTLLYTKVTSLDGKEIINTTKKHISLATLPSGIYIATIVTNKGTTNKQIVKE